MKRLQVQFDLTRPQVCTILSQNTTDVNSARAFAKLKEKFPEWEMVRTAENGMLCVSVCTDIVASTVLAAKLQFASPAFNAAHFQVLLRRASNQEALLQSRQSASRFDASIQHKCI